MPVITVELRIAAPIARVFDLARSIDLHVASTRATGESAVAGVQSGLIGLGQSVTWRARHFGVWQQLTSKITRFDSPHAFQDCMVAGAFRYFQHDHLFIDDDGGTIMRDVFAFASPGLIVGWLVDQVLMKQYLRTLLVRRNQVIKQTAESDAWRHYLPD